MVLRFLVPPMIDGVRMTGKRDCQNDRIGDCAEPHKWSQDDNKNIKAESVSMTNSLKGTITNPATS